VLFQLLALSLIPFCIETVAYSLDRIAGKPIRATLSQLAVAVLTLGGSALLFGRLGLNAVGVAVLGADLVVALVRLPTVLAAVRRRPGVIAPPAGAAQPRRPTVTVPLAGAAQPRRPAVSAPPPATAAQPVPVPGSHAQPDSPRDTDRRDRDTDRRNYAGRHRAPGPGGAAPTGR
jgi:hypothetical protein